jgi:hypothetical protein
MSPDRNLSPFNAIFLLNQLGFFMHRYIFVGMLINKTIIDIATYEIATYSRVLLFNTFPSSFLFFFQVYNEL